ncbi:hypothetical protein ACP4OV_000993 [Aristida adscensionis]
MELAEDSSYRLNACGGTKHEAGTALLARKLQAKAKNLLKIILVAFLQVVQLLPQACCLPLPELSVKQEIIVMSALSRRGQNRGGLLHEKVCSKVPRR